MKQFIETICIQDGMPRHLEWHQRRVDATMNKFYPGHHHSWRLTDCIEIPHEHLTGTIRCRIIYDAHYFSIQYFPYSPKTIRTLKLIEALPGLDYSYKYADRNGIEELYSQKGDFDDILITRDGWITDTSLANIAFRGEKKWYTPSLPLLAGTTWKRLVSEGIIFPRPIHRDDVPAFESFRIFNALNAFETTEPMPANYIKTEWVKN